MKKQLERSEVLSEHGLETNKALSAEAAVVWLMLDFKMTPITENQQPNTT
jgi:hypothetical protein